MVLILILAFAVSLVLILVLRGSAPQVPYHGSEMPVHRLGELPGSQEKALSNQKDEERETPPAALESLGKIDLAALEKFCRLLIQKVGLRFRYLEPDGKHAFHMLASFEQPILRGEIIICGHLVEKGGAVASSEVIGFSDMVKAERAMKGVFVTNGYFSEEVMKLNEGASIELIDVRGLYHSMKEMTPEFLHELLHPKIVGH